MCRAPEPLCEGQRAGALTAPLHGPETPPLTGPSRVSYTHLLFLNAPHLTCSLARWRPAAPATAFESFLADLGCRRLTAAPGQAPELLRDGDTGLPSTAIETYKGEGEALPTTWKGGPCPGSSQRWGKIVLC